ncbi:MAG: NADH-quinone oxidoreductase subunit B family protein [Candidatus Limnocylindria bacterium]
MAESTLPRVGVVKMASCDGCQLTLLDLEDELLAIGQRFDLVEFPEATSRRSSGPYDVLLVEGSISTPEQLEQIVELRARTKLLVTIGACATAGGIQAMRNWSNEPEWRASVYPSPEDVESLATATPVAEHVTVDAELRGCPIDGRQLLELLTALRLGRRPQLPDEAVCNECKRLGRVCVLVASDLPCLGPVTATGCGALCPGYDRGCYACFGPKDAPNVASLARWLGDGRSPEQVDRLFATFNGYAPAFREASERAVASMQPAPRKRRARRSTGKAH